VVDRDPGAPRVFRITVAYDGTAYAGWQVQEGVATVQGVLESAAAGVNGEETRVLGAGRTDAGVHARGQAARFETRRRIEADRVPHALNAHLPEDVVVVGAAEVAAEWHPIRDAVAKHYRYTLKRARFRDPFDDRYVLRIADAPDLGAMRAAGERLLGTRDFAPFQKAGSPRLSTVRSLQRLDVETEADYIHLRFVGDGFLYGMARNLAGTLLRAGRRLLAPEAIAPAPLPLDPAVAGPCLPPRGLCLMQVDYRGTR
jgi:tRNA pseudouridine38-40 synthase